jgi:hypothetical protein
LLVVATCGLSFTKTAAFDICVSKTPTNDQPLHFFPMLFSESCRSLLVVATCGPSLTKTVAA